MYQIFTSEDANSLPYIVYMTRNGKTERAKHIGKRGQFKTLEEAKQAVFNITHYGQENV